jgi:hypothetical protein
MAILALIFKVAAKNAILNIKEVTGRPLIIIVPIRWRVFFYPQTTQIASVVLIGKDYRRACNLLCCWHLSSEEAAALGESTFKMAFWKNAAYHIGAYRASLMP